MKRVGYIYENIYDKKNLRAAIYKAVEGKKDKRLVRHILKNEDYYIEELHTVLKNKTLQLKPSFRGFRKDGPHQKERFITIPSFYPDQVVHWALMLQIQPIIERGMYLYNCGSIPKRGTKLAKKYVERTLKKHNPRYGLKLDIKKFFQSASISKMMELFEKKIKDKSVLNLIEDILINGEPGLPIGYYTSQWFSNFYLEELDHFIKEQLRIPHYVRYVDDMLLFSNNKRQLHRARVAISKFLKDNNFEVEIKSNWQVFQTRVRPVDFVGYRMTSKVTTVRKHIFYKVNRRANALSKRLTIKNTMSYMSLLGWLKKATYGEQYIQKYLEPKVSSYKVRKYIGGKARNDLHRKSARRNRTSTTSSYHRKNRVYSQEYQGVRTTT